MKKIKLPPIKDKSKNKLWIVRESFHEWIQSDQGHAGGTQVHAVPVQLQQDQQADT